MKYDRNHGHLSEGAVVYARNPAVTPNGVVFNPTDEQYLECDPPEKRLHQEAPTEPAGEGKHWEQDGWTETDTDITRKWKAVDDPKVYRKFSKLKIYGTISMLPPSNDATAWQKVQTWLEGKVVNGVNGWMAFQLAQEISEDHPLFEAWAEEARVLLGLSQEQFETLLNACILEG